MTAGRTGRILGATVASVWLVVLVLVDVALPHTVVLAALFAMAPLIACAVLPAAATAGFAVAATGFAAGSGWWNHAWGTGQQAVRITDVALVSAAAVVIAAVRTRREHSYERMAAIAEVAQRAILPTLPRVAGPVAVSARYVSAAEDALVGGDLYDCYHSDHRVRFLVGDVRGKGVAGVEHAARAIRAFRQSAATDSTLADVATHMSAYLAGFFDDEEFVTALLVEVSDPWRVTLVSCGHPLPLLVGQAQGARFVDLPAGLPLGLGEQYDAVTVTWQPGDRLLIYTDGLSEARNKSGEFMPLLALEPLLRAGTVDDALDAVLAAVRRHVPHGRFADDLADLLLENVGSETSAPTATPTPVEKTLTLSGPGRPPAGRSRRGQPWP